MVDAAPRGHKHYGLGLLVPHTLWVDAAPLNRLSHRRTTDKRENNSRPFRRKTMFGEWLFPVARGCAPCSARAASPRAAFPFWGKKCALSVKQRAGWFVMTTSKDERVAACVCVRVRVPSRFLFAGFVCSRLLSNGEGESICDSCRARGPPPGNPHPAP